MSGRGRAGRTGSAEVERAPFRVLVAEDSRTLSELLVAILGEDPELEIVGTAKDGEEAVTMATELRPDLVTMDIHMPKLDGLEATKEIMAMAPTPILIVTSSGARADEERTFAALRAGALAVVEKPLGPGSPDFERLARELLLMVKAMADVRVVRRRRALAEPSRRPSLVAGVKRSGIEVVGIGASTGGPAAVSEVLEVLPPTFAVPIVVVQHIGAGFERSLIQWLGTRTLLRVKAAEDGELLRARTVYVAPHGRHTTVAPGKRVALEAGDPVLGHLPAATRLFESLAVRYGPACAGVVLSGMGRDGAAGLADIRRAGGVVLAQDPETSVVQGMPGEAIRSGCVDAVLPPAEIGRHLLASTEAPAGARP